MGKKQTQQFSDAVRRGTDNKLTLKEGTHKTSVRRKISSKLTVPIDVMGAFSPVGNPTGGRCVGEFSVRSA